MLAKNSTLKASYTELQVVVAIIFLLFIDHFCILLVRLYLLLLLLLLLLLFLELLDHYAHLESFRAVLNDKKNLNPVFSVLVLYSLPKDGLEMSLSVPFTVSNIFISDSCCLVNIQSLLYGLADQPSQVLPSIQSIKKKI